MTECLMVSGVIQILKNYLELLRIADIIRIYDVNILRIENCFGIYGLLSFPHCVV